MPAKTSNGTKSKHDLIPDGHPDLLITTCGWRILKQFEGHHLIYCAECRGATRLT